MAYFYYKGGKLHRVENGNQYNSKYLPENENESMKYAESLAIDMDKAKMGILTARNLRIAEQYSKRFPALSLSGRELAFIRSELNNHLSDMEKGSPLVCQTLPWDNEYYRYTAINFGFNDYKIIRKVFDDLPDSIADIVMEEYNQYEKK